jgi:hypothetical protein
MGACLDSSVSRLFNLTAAKLRAYAPSSIVGVMAVALGRYRATSAPQTAAKRAQGMVARLRGTATRI